MKRKIVIDQDLIYNGVAPTSRIEDLIYNGVALTSRIELYMSTHNMLNVGKINGKRYQLFDGTNIYIHNTDKHIIVEKL